MTRRPSRQLPRRRPAFTLVELLVVIGIIVVLLAILVPVVSRMRVAVQTANTNAQLQKISAAINNYFSDFQAYPGLTPNVYFNPATANSPPRILQNLTSSEDLVLALLGGPKVDPAWVPGAVPKVTFDPNLVGQGTVSINKLGIKKHNGYMPRRDEELTPGTDGLLSNEPEFTYVKDTVVPEFMDLYPEQRPILYMRTTPGVPKVKIDSVGQKILGPDGKFSATFAYNWDMIEMYLKSPSNGFANDPKVADFNAKVPSEPTNPDQAEIFRYFANSTGDAPRNGSSYLLMSAGPDRRFGTPDDLVYGSGGGQ